MSLPSSLKGMTFAFILLMAGADFTHSSGAEIKGHTSEDTSSIIKVVLAKSESETSFDRLLAEYGLKRSADLPRSAPGSPTEWFEVAAKPNLAAPLAAALSSHAKVKSARVVDSSSESRTITFGRQFSSATTPSTSNARELSSSWDELVAVLNKGFNSKARILEDNKFHKAFQMLLPDGPHIVNDKGTVFERIRLDVVATASGKDFRIIVSGHWLASRYNPPSKAPETAWQSMSPTYDQRLSMRLQEVLSAFGQPLQ